MKSNVRRCEAAAPKDYRPLYGEEAETLTENSVLDARRGYRMVVRFGNMIKQGREEEISERVDNIADNAGVSREVALKGLYEFFYKHFFTEIDRKSSNERESLGIEWVQNQPEL